MVRWLLEAGALLVWCVSECRGGLAMLRWLMEAGALHGSGGSADLYRKLGYAWPKETSAHAEQLLEAVRCLAPAVRNTAPGDKIPIMIDAAQRGDPELLRLLQHTLGYQLEGALLVEAAWGGGAARVCGSSGHAGPGRVLLRGRGAGQMAAGGAVLGQAHPGRAAAGPAGGCDKGAEASGRAVGRAGAGGGGQEDGGVGEGAGSRGLESAGVAARDLAGLTRACAAAPGWGVWRALRGTGALVNVGAAGSDDAGRRDRALCQRWQLRGVRRQRAGRAPLMPARCDGTVECGHAQCQLVVSTWSSWYDWQTWQPS